MKLYVMNSEHSTEFDHEGKLLAMLLGWQYKQSHRGLLFYS